jgi:hypothetical protein
MSEKSYTEDIFIKFYDQLVYDRVFSGQDSRILGDFYFKLTSQEELTQNQANYLLRLMSKYQEESKAHGVDLSDTLEFPSWKNSFRVLDKTKTIFVEKNELGAIEICIKFPFSFKETFEKEFEAGTGKRSSWDPEKKIRKLDPYNFNIIQLFEFVKNHNFIIDDTFMDVVSSVEEIWEHQDEILPYSKKEKNSVVLCNAPDDAESFFESNKTGNVHRDLFLAKRLGFILKDNCIENIFDKIAAASAKEFWIKDFSKFLELHRALDGYTAIILDRNTENIVVWLERFLEATDRYGISRTEIKVCFRESDNKTSKLNGWIKENNVGGTVKEGKILIFQHKPPKWIFKDNMDIKLIGINSFTPVSEPITAAWMGAHHCVCYLTEIRPTKSRGNDIVEL